MEGRTENPGKYEGRDERELRKKLSKREERIKDNTKEGSYERELRII